MHRAVQVVANSVIMVVGDTRGGVLVLPSNVSSGQLVPIDLPGYVPSAKLYELSGTGIVEVMRYAPPRGSWMYVDEENVHVERDGKITMVTTVDSLFVAVGLMFGQKNAMFEPADTILPRVLKVCAAQLSLVCETKTAGDETFYRFSEERAIQWLVAKMRKLVDATGIPEHEAAAVVARYLPEMFAEKLEARFEAPKITKGVAELDDAQKTALDAILNDAKAERERDEGAEDDAGRVKKKQKVVKKPKSSSKVPTRSYSRSVKSYFSKK